ncbi:hypothetical protein [Achromobacter deleyi]|uniref:hypothetical protein n=1 Tax=Achromobacter deleyi TaxID=1353891 RepID=UPI0014911699|nr:hypothetical protein [Achromobacter deleyi]QVQ28807.1 hypothetical protein HLG70_10570 [Achromobacter deleyi]UIP18922.1 hypothetical protein LYZ39_18155 [Achromobacter deleyi]
MTPPIFVTSLWLRRLWLLALAGLLALQPGLAGAQVFDRQAENQRYQQWLRDFKQDLLRLRQSPDPKQADVDALFANTVVPGSRATGLVKELAAAKPGSTSGEIHFVGIQRVLLGALSDAVVAGDGGIYPDTQAAYQKDALRVRYMHVDGGGRLESHFSDPEVFKPYRLPASGVFARDAYPFLLFEERDGKLRLGGVSREFWDLVRFMDALQYA